MDEKLSLKVHELALAHWTYVEETLIAHKVASFEIDVARYHYLSAFVHGFKHAVEFNNGDKL